MLWIIQKCQLNLYENITIGIIWASAHLCTERMIKQLESCKLFFVMKPSIEDNLKDIKSGKNATVVYYSGLNWGLTNYYYIAVTSES